MILILSQGHLEGSTEDVMDWLYYQKQNLKRINGEEYIHNYSEIHALFKDIAPSVKSVWNRRWFGKKSVKNIVNKSSLDLNNCIEFFIAMVNETTYLNKQIHQLLEGKKYLTYPYENAYSKLFVIEAAESVGLKTPETFICNTKKDLMLFLAKNKRIITKNIAEVAILQKEDVRFATTTVEVSWANIHKIPDVFYPSLFQELVEKEYELRVFYLDCKFYAMAIFSQLDEQTAIDFRNYNYTVPNRNVPYQLPQNVENDLQNFLTKLNFTTGSIDLIKTKQGEYVFL